MRCPYCSRPMDKHSRGAKAQVIDPENGFYLMVGRIIDVDPDKRTATLRFNPMRAAVVFHQFIGSFTTMDAAGFS